MPKQSLRHQLQQVEHLDDDRLTDGFIQLFFAMHKLVDHGLRVEETGFTATLTPEQEKQWDAAEKIALNAGFEFANDDDFKRVGKKYDQILKFMTESGTLINLPNGRIHKNYFDKAVSMAMEMIEKDGSLKLADFRNAIDTSRKYAVDILDKMDEMGYTLFKDGIRVKA